MTRRERSEGSKVAGKKVMVTGGAGFVGSHLVQELARANEVIILDDFSTGKDENISEVLQAPNVKIVKGSILNSALVYELMNGIDYVFHLAADPNVVDSVENPLKTNEVNITGTLNILLAARDRQVKKVVYASSSAVYGDAPSPNVETMAPNPTSPYALSKLAGEYYCQLFSNIYGLPTVSLRYFNIYGPRQDADSDYAGVIPKFIYRLLRNQPPIVYGDGEQTRDFIFVGDVVRATILSAKRGPQGEVINIGSNKNLSVNQLANKLIKLTGNNLKPTYAEPQPGDVRHSLADISKAQRLLDFRANFSLEDGLAKTIAYFEKVTT